MTDYCLGNLNIALRSLGAWNQAEYSGAAGALSLILTAGAPIGSPTKELWVTYKLMPLAGILSMLMSLGGTMVPTQAGAYNLKVSFTYGGIMATTNTGKDKKHSADSDDDNQGGYEETNIEDRLWRSLPGEFSGGQTMRVAHSTELCG